MKTCWSCGKNISSKDDANILAFLGFLPRIFCNNCYSKKEKTILRNFLYSPRYPINGRGYMFFGIVITIIFTLMSFPLFYSNTITSPIVKGFIFFIWLLILLWVWLLRAIAMSKIKDLS